ncbi:hypothetical protein [Streptomyces amakusaensis]|uniref:Uncharacterized protein n=1 Tax=Streptomyces amakusaensis TaxID=67271 RepID=A0ABW0APS4_9ACTN
MVTSNAIHELSAHTTDLVDLSWPSDTHPAVHIDLSGDRVTATAYSQAAREVLEQHRFTRTGTGYALPGELSERESLGIVAQAEAHLWDLGLTVRTVLGITTTPTPGLLVPAARPASVKRRGR